MTAVTPESDVFPSSHYVQRKEELTQKTLTLGSGRVLSYLEEGPTGGIPVIALHGGCTGKEMFIFEKPIEGVRLFTIDRPGYGTSTNVDWRQPEPYSLETAVADIKEFVQKLELNDIVVVGYSSGATWAINLAAALPEQVRACVALAARCDVHHAQASDELRAASAHGDQYPTEALFSGVCDGAWSRGSFLGCCCACTWDWGAALVMVSVPPRTLCRSC